MIRDSSGEKRMRGTGFAEAVVDSVRLVDEDIAVDSFEEEACEPPFSHSKTSKGKNQHDFKADIGSSDQKTQVNNMPELSREDCLVVGSLQPLYAPHILAEALENIRNGKEDPQSDEKTFIACVCHVR
mmetsp:Transcript_20899/g.29202  ORF Transcript_20899/g.29202 Transcript_20899/m.29202 type:complete len:128 (-) Transcript_20899:32-415(-)